MRSALLHRVVAAFLAVLLPAGAAWAQSVCPLIPMGATPTITISPQPSGLNYTNGLLDCVPHQFAVIDYSGLPLDITFTFASDVTLTGFAGIAGGVAPNDSTAWDNSWAVSYLGSEGNYHPIVVDARSPATFDYVVNQFKFATLGFAYPVTAKKFIVRATRNSGDKKVHLSELHPLFAQASAQPGEDICALIGTTNRPAFCTSSPITSQPKCSNVTKIKEKCSGNGCVELYAADCSSFSPRVFFARGIVAGGSGPNGTYPLMGVVLRYNGVAVSEASTYFANRSDVYGNIFAPATAPGDSTVSACVVSWVAQYSVNLPVCTD